MCPPGFPVLVYGEEILAEHIELLGDTPIKVVNEQ
jgi:arginine/lysine/ornithine decarboxylase